MGNAKTAVVTGASSGIGQATARLLSQTGYEVIALARRGERLKALAAECPGVTPRTLDLTDDQALQELCAELAGRQQPLDLLVNNAGYAVRGLIADVPRPAVERMYKVNFFAQIPLIQAVLPGMKRARQGMIINISSLAGKIALPGNGFYASSKFALEAMSEALRLEAAPFGVKVVVIRPGPVKTEFQPVALEMSPHLAQAPPEHQPVYEAMRERLQEFFKGQVPVAEDAARLIMEVVGQDDPEPSYLLGPVAEEFMVVRAGLDDRQWQQEAARRSGMDRIKA
jgi:short-subunit dehydrogenase